MKKVSIALLFVFSSVVLVSCGETNTSAKVNKANLEKAKKRDLENSKGAPVVAFDKTEYDFGTVLEGTIVETTFKVTNNGKTDLIISNAQATCGCTVPVWPKEPIKPGESGDVLVKFNTTGKPNKQSKTVTLYTNTATGREVVRLKGSVTPKAKS